MARCFKVVDIGHQATQRRQLKIPMRAHIVIAHPERQSYNAHLAAVARRTLEAQGATVTVSDLYQMNFDPCERATHYANQLEPQRFDVQSEQRHASANKTVPPNVAAEIALLDQADLLILQYPMWWHLPPAMLKGWLDRVFIYGDVYTSKQRFEHGRYVGKHAMLSVTVGTSQATYAHDGRSGDIDWAATLTGRETRATVPFNQMAHWGADGHIKPDAPVYSPFVRRKEQLELE